MSVFYLIMYITNQGLVSQLLLCHPSSVVLPFREEHTPVFFLFSLPSPLRQAAQWRENSGGAVIGKDYSCGDGGFLSLSLSLSLSLFIYLFFFYLNKLLQKEA